MQVEDVEVLVAQRPGWCAGADGSGASGATEPLAAVGMLLPRGVTPAVGRRAVARAEHPDLVARAPQRPGQPEHLALHAAGHGEAVRADEADPHRPSP